MFQQKPKPRSPRIRSEVQHDNTQAHIGHALVCAVKFQCLQCASWQHRCPPDIGSQVGVGLVVCHNCVAGWATALHPAWELPSLFFVPQSGNLLSERIPSTDGTCDLHLCPPSLEMSSYHARVQYTPEHSRLQHALHVQPQKSPLLPSRA